MNLRQIQYFVVLAEELHFRRAAERLAITQAPLSVAIQSLERELGTMLFRRTQRRVELTEMGMAFRRHAIEILERLDYGITDMKELVAGNAGRLRIGFTSAAPLLTFFPNMIASFCLRYPKVQVTLHDLPSTSQLSALQAHEIDVGIMRGTGQGQAADIAYTRLFRDRLIVVMRTDNPLATKPDLCLADLRDEKFLFYPPRSGIGIGDLLRELCAKRGFTPNVVQEVIDTSALVCLAATGMGVAVVPSELQCINVPNTVFRTLSDEDMVTDVWLVARAGEPSPLIATFNTIVKGALAAWKKDDAQSIFASTIGPEGGAAQVALETP
jgi:DNA-binding transcriptional LysR family regulator